MSTQRIAEFVGLDLPVMEYEGIVDMMALERRSAAAAELETLAERAAWLAAYLNERGGGDNEDRGHKMAVHRANHTARKVWRDVFGRLGIRV